MRRDHEIVELRLHADVVHRDGRQIVLERLPRRAAIVRDPDALFGSEIDEVRIADVGADRARPLVSGRPFAIEVQCLAEVVRYEDVRLVVAGVVAVVDRVGRAVAQRRGRDRREASVLGRIGRRNVLPMLAAVERELNKPSSVPTQISPLRSVDPSMSRIVSLSSAPDTSCVIGPPEGA